jgi:UMF1 family MFS transporter
MSNNKKVHRYWSLYDWANSAYNLVITSTIFPAYYIAVTTSNDGSDKVAFFGIEFINSALLNYSIAFAYFIIAIFSPILSSIADVKGNKKKYMQMFSTIGAISCSSLFFFTPDRIEIGIIFSMLAALGYCGSLVFYNAFLPEIATPDEQNKVSAQGFAYGYIGSVLLQLICLGFLFYNFSDDTLGARISFLLVGIWWLIFAQISIGGLPQNVAKSSNGTDVSIWQKGFVELRKVWSEIKQYVLLKRYLSAFFFYSMGVQTVMLAAAEFGKKEVVKLDENLNEIPLETNELVIAILLIQLVAIVGATVLARLGNKFGNIKVLIGVLIIWIGICCSAYFVRYVVEFYLLAAVVGLVMGGIQSMSRSTYSQLIPPTTKDITSYFSFYDVTEKLAIVIGMFTFGLIEHLTGNMRMAIFGVTAFFVMGLMLLIWARIAERNLKH